MYPEKVSPDKLLAERSERAAGNALLLVSSKQPCLIKSSANFCLISDPHVFEVSVLHGTGRSGRVNELPQATFYGRDTPVRESIFRMQSSFLQIIQGEEVSCCHDPFMPGEMLQISCNENRLIFSQQGIQKRTVISSGISTSESAGLIIRDFFLISSRSTDTLSSGNLNFFLLRTSPYSLKIPSVMTGMIRPSRSIMSNLTVAESSWLERRAETRTLVSIMTFLFIPRSLLLPDGSPHQSLPYSYPALCFSLLIDAEH